MIATATAPTTEIRPQRGPQESFLATSADIAIYGGAAGGGKSWALLLEPLRHAENADFGAVIFRRTSTQVRNEGSLWDESMKLYPLVGGMPRESILEWQFSSGARVKFAHLEHETDKLNWQGSQIPLIGFDELTHFTEGQFWYLLSRNRSTCGVRPYVRATCNPDADSWVARLIAWWISEETGYPIPERAGRIRWFVRIDDKIIWSDRKVELEAKYPKIPPKSLTFIPSRLEDNPALMRADPGYLANLLALPTVERERLHGGNWKIRRMAGNFFREEWFQLVDALPAKGKLVRFWDKAGSETDGDFSAGVLMMEHDGLYFICDVRHGRWSPGERNKVMERTAELDEVKWGRHNVAIWVEQEPGNGGKESAQISVRQLARFGVHLDHPTTNKEARAMPFSAQCEAGNVRVLREKWTRDYIDELVAFPNPEVHDDQVDASSGAFNKLVRSPGKPVAPKAAKSRFA